MNARRLSGWLSLVALAGYWLAITLEKELDVLAETVEQLRERAAVLELELASRTAAGDDD